jgi:hypothetical protein
MGHAPAHFPPQPGHPTRSLLSLSLPPRAHLSAPASPLAHPLSSLPFLSLPGRPRAPALLLSSPFFSSATAPETSGELPRLGPARQCALRRSTKGEPLRPGTQNPNPSRHRRLPAPPPSAPPRRPVCLAAEPSLCCAPDPHNPRVRSLSPSRSCPGLAIGSYASVSTGIRDEAVAGESLRHPNSSPPVFVDPS